MARDERWARFGWQGIALDVPEGWDLRRFDGTRKSGYARLADDEAIRLELRWEKPRNGGDFRQMADKVARHFGQQRGFTIERNTRLVEPGRRDVETFICRPAAADGDGPLFYNMSTYCRECGRLILVRIAYRRNESIRPTARRVFGSLEDHSYDGAEAWATYGLSFAAPEAVELDQALIYPGSLDFRFEGGPDRIDVGRLALGSMILEKAPLADWFRAFARKRFRKVRFEAEEAEVMGHPGLDVRGRLRGIGALAARLLWRQQFHARVWHCPESDKLYYYAVLARPGRLDRLERFWDRLICHD
jgi:hypothetical protein